MKSFRDSKKESQVPLEQGIPGAEYCQAINPGGGGGGFYRTDGKNWDKAWKEVSLSVHLSQPRSAQVPSFSLGHDLIQSFQAGVQNIKWPESQLFWYSLPVYSTVSELWLWCLYPPWPVSASCSHLQEPNLKYQVTERGVSTHLIGSCSVHTKTTRVSGRVRRMCKFVKLGSQSDRAETGRFLGLMTPTFGS